MYPNEGTTEKKATKKDEKFNVRIAGHVTKSTKDRLKLHHARMVSAYEGDGSVVFSDVLRDIVEKGLEVAEQELITDKSSTDY